MVIVEKRLNYNAKRLNYNANWELPDIYLFTVIGYGGLPFNRVLPIVDNLPNNIILYK